MKIQNHLVEDFAKFLLDMKLKGKDNRMRNRFVKFLQEHLKILQEDHKALLNEYCKKDEHGDFKTINRNGNTYYDIDEVEAFQREFQILMDEYLFIPNDENYSSMISHVKELVLSCEKEFSGQEAMKYENYCEIFEQSDTVSIQS